MVQGRKNLMAVKKRIRKDTVAQGLFSVYNLKIRRGSATDASRIENHLPAAGQAAWEKGYKEREHEQETSGFDDSGWVWPQ